MTTKTIRGLEIFAVGKWNGREFTRADLDAMVESFNELGLADRLPLKLGHSAADSEPSQGWLSELWREGDKLLATAKQVPAELVDKVKEGRYRHVSVELLSDVVANGREYPWVLSALAILGSARPAVDVLKPLHQVMARALPAGLRFGERLAFSRAPDDAESLRAEVKRLTSQLVKGAFDTAIRERRILPRDRHAFETRMGADATLEDAQRWIASTPAPQAFYGQQTGERGAERHAMDAGAPDVELVTLAQAVIEKSGGKLDYFAAQQQVLRANPELAERYRDMPGVKD